MNCDEFNLAVLAEPGNETPQRSAHADACPECARLLSRVQRMERRLSAAMSVPVPPSLSGDMPDIEALARARESSQGDNVVAFPGDRRRGAARGRWQALAGLAAAVAIVAVFALRPAGVAPVDGEALAAEVFDHIDHELGYMRPASSAVNNATLEAALQPAGVSLNRQAAPGLVSYAKDCVIDGRHVPHLVVQGANGPVTVLILRDQPVDGPMSIMRDGLEGVLLPVGDGDSIAIIGRDAASVDAVRDLADDGLGFTT